MSIPKRRLFASFWDSPPPERPAGHINPKTIWNNYLQSGRGQRVGVAGMSARRRERGRRAARGARRRSWGGGALAWAVSARVGRGAWGGEGRGRGRGQGRRQRQQAKAAGHTEAAGRGRRPGEGRGGDVGEAKGAWAKGSAWGEVRGVARDEAVGEGKGTGKGSRRRQQATPRWRGCQWGCQCGGRRPSWS